MAIRVDAQDLERYPGNIKTITVDQEKIVPVGFEGDEQFVLSFSTSGYSDNVDRTAIQKLYITDMNGGWCKSSGLGGNTFDVTASHYKLKVKLDTMTSGTVIELATSATPITGEDVAADIETKIRARDTHVPAGLASAYKSASVEFKGGKFWIVSGSVSSSYTGDYRSSAAVLPADDHDCSEQLGFNLPVTSEVLAGVESKEAALVNDYIRNTATLTIGAGTGVVVGDCLMITDGDTKIDYFTAISGTVDPTVTVCTSVNNGYEAIKNDYTGTVSGIASAKVQVLREQDPDGVPSPWYESVDSITRFGVKYIIQQLDFSS